MWGSFSSVGLIVNEMPSVSAIAATLITAGVWCPAEMPVTLWLLPLCRLPPQIRCYLYSWSHVMSRWTLHLRLQQILTLECAIRPLNLLQGGTSPCTPELKWGSRMHVLIEGSLNGLHCCGNETPAANEHRLDCFLGSEWAKAAPQIQSVLLILPPPQIPLLLLLLLQSSFFYQGTTRLLFHTCS